MKPGPCMYCGLNPAEGYACVTQGDVTSWYCHGDDDGVSCYERRSWNLYRSEECETGTRRYQILDLKDYLKEEK